MAKDCSRRDFIKMLGMGTAAVFLPGAASGSQKLFSSEVTDVNLELRLTNFPNIVYILCDDLGYGDVSCLNPNCRVTTSNIDRVASQGRIFTDAHTTSAVCTPTRYGILTGRYNWRSRLKRSVLKGYSMPLIEAGRQTVASYLKENRYKTACIGKWHLGLDWAVLPNKTKPLETDNSYFGTDYMDNDPRAWIDYTKPFGDGPTTKGFDYFFGIAASLDMAPYTFLEGNMVKAVPTTWTTEFSNAGGLKAPGFDGHAVLSTFRDKATDWIKQNKTQPFFLYMPLNAPHYPLMPSAGFVGSSASARFPGGSPFYDYVLEVDDVIGKVMDCLDANGLKEKTLFIVTSDNGPERSFRTNKDADDGEDQGFAGSAGEFRGRKRDNWDGGHRVPFIVRWPGKVAAGTTCSQIICTSDLFATCSNIIGKPIRPPDSMNILPAILGTDNGVPIREATVHHSGSGQFAIRKGKWKLITHKGSGEGDGGNTYSEEPNKILSTDPPMQLYDMEVDKTENDDNNCYLENLGTGGKVEELLALLDKYKTQGHSQPNGPPDFM